MYAPQHAAAHPDRPAFIMASTGETVTYAEFEARSNQLAHLLVDQGLERTDHYSVFMENNNRYFESCGAGERSGLYYTCINSFLTSDEVAFIVDNSESQVLITSKAKLPVVLDTLPACPNVSLTLVVGGNDADGLAAHDLTDGATVGESTIRDYASAIAEKPTHPIANERLGTSMLYSSGTTGRPKGILRPLPDVPPTEPLPLFGFLANLWQYREDMVYLSPAPLYHSAPQAANNLTIAAGGTAIVMERFDAATYLSLIEKYKVTHSQLVPTMFSRLLKLPEEDRERYDLSSLEIAIHAAAPCPAPVKEAMIDWWGPIIHEYYGATEGIGFTACDSEEWLAHRGTVGKVILGDLHILDDDMNPMPKGQPGTIWFKTATDFAYHNDEAKTLEATSPDGTMTTVNDIGYVDDDGFLYLTDRKTFMIISGGVNIYPQETEDLLITHPSVYDAAVIGVPNEDLGEEVKAIIQPMPGIAPDDALAQTLIEFCGENLSRQKVPRSIDFEEELPRLPTGKLYKRVLRDRYWADRTDGPNKIV